jgi:glycosyltransferase involved in cell wall biosynthesis
MNAQGTAEASAATPGSLAASQASEVSSYPGALPLVSICISAYNVERFLSETLQSILRQTYRNTEIILVDNGSSDRTFEIAQSFHDERFRCFRIPENIGGYQAMNKVAALAKGELIAIYHSDDVYEPDIVEKEVAFLTTYPQAGAVFAMDHFIDEDGQVFGGLDVPSELASQELLRYEDVFPYMLRHGCTMFICPTFMTRRRVFAEVGPFQPERFDIASDTEMWLRLTRRYPVGILNERLVRYRVGPWQWSKRWRRLRTEANRELDVMETYLELDAWRDKLQPADLIEYHFRQCDDHTTRAANFVILGDFGRVRELLRGRYPFRTLLNGIRRRKLRVLLLRAVLKGMLSLGAERLLARLLVQTEYGGRIA